MCFTLAVSIVVFAVLAAAARTPTRRETDITIPLTRHDGLLNPDGSANFNALNAHIAYVEAWVICEH